MYFHVVYGGARRRYGGAGRNSPCPIINDKGPNSSSIGLLSGASFYTLMFSFFTP